MYDGSGARYMVVVVRSVCVAENNPAVLQITISLFVSAVAVFCLSG